MEKRHFVAVTADIWDSKKITETITITRTIGFGPY